MAEGANYFEGSGVPTAETKSDEARVAAIRGKSSPNASIEGTSGSFPGSEKNKRGVS